MVCGACPCSNPSCCPTTQVEYQTGQPQGEEAEKWHGEERHRERVRERERRDATEREKKKYENGQKMEELKGFFAEEKIKGVKGVKAISAVSLR